MSEAKTEREFLKSHILYEGVVQRYLSYITGIDEKKMWPSGITPPHYIAEFMTKSGRYRLRAEIVDKDWMLDTKCVSSTVFRTTLTEAVGNIQNIYKLRRDDPVVPTDYRESVIACDPKNTTLVAFVSGPRRNEIRDLPKRIGFVLEKL